VLGHEAALAAPAAPAAALSPRQPPRLRRGTMRRLLLRLALLRTARAFFVVLDGEKQCFLVEQPLDTQLTIKYEIPANEKQNEHRLKLTLTDRRTKTQVFSRVVSDHKDEVTMATGSEAAHDLCLKPQAPGQVRVALEIERGHGQKYYAEMASEHKMDRLQVEVVKLNDELAEILNEADYMKEKEVRFHRKAERVNVAAVWWPVLQIGILVLTAVLQVQSLKKYFQAKNFY
jgi:hypothetical protein